MLEQVLRPAVIPAAAGTSIAAERNCSWPRNAAASSVTRQKPRLLLLHFGSFKLANQTWMLPLGVVPRAALVGAGG